MDDLEREALRAELTALRADLRAVAATGDRAEATTTELAAVVASLIQILHLRESLADGHLRMLDRLRGHVQRLTTPTIRINRSTVDKYAEVGVEIDCAARMHLCHGRCCGYDIALSEQDLVEGKLAWRIDEPYWLPHTEDGYCSYQDRDDGGCRAYHHRPAMCRTYDCRTDARVWIDFDARIAAPLAPGLTPIRRNPNRP